MINYIKLFIELIGSKTIQINKSGAEDNNPIDRFRKGCVKIKLSNQLTCVFESNKKILKLPDLAIIVDCSTRWHSTKHMIDRFLVVKEAYRLTVNSDDDIRENCSLNDEQIQYITIVNEVLTKFEKITVWLSSQQ